MADVVPLAGRILNAIIAPIRYLALTIWPMNLSILYPHPYLPGGVPPSALTWVGVGAAWVAIACGIGSARRTRYVAAGLAWFLISLVPVLGIVQVGQQAIADRYSYMSLLGIFAILCFGARDAFANLGTRERAVAAGLVTTGLILLGIRSADQVGAWTNTLTLYESSLQSTPNSAILQFNFGNRLLDAGREREAITHLESARSLRPDWREPTMNLAWLIATTDDPELIDPERSLALALEFTDENDEDANLLDTLAAAYAATGDFARAESVARRAVSLAHARGMQRSTRVFHERWRLYQQDLPYVESIRPEETKSASGAL
jgi:hypothetical protein